jgi:hypothetical protein
MRQYRLKDPFSIEIMGTGDDRLQAKGTLFQLNYVNKR